jgi:FixJ family two-component response regulator
MNDEVVIFVVDNDSASRDSVAEVLRSKGLEVRAFESAEAFLSAYQEQGLQVLVVELDLPGTSGLELQQQLKAANRAIPIIMTSASAGIPAAVQAVQQGAVTFLQKPTAADELGAAVDLALQKARDQQAAALSKQELRDRFARLTGSERLVLIRVLEGQPNKRIATEMDMGLRTVELRRSHIMRKIGAASLTELIRLAMDADFPSDLPPEATPRQTRNNVGRVHTAELP